MDSVRFATKEEIDAIAPVSDITKATSVISFGGKDFAVIRNCFELDPVIFGPDTGDKRKALFLMNLETALRMQGVQEVYFNVNADDETYLNVLHHWGAVNANDTPQIRLKKVL